MMEKNNQPEITSRYKQLVSLVKEADRAIETWIFHWIDQIEKEEQSQSSQLNE